MLNEGIIRSEANYIIENNATVRKTAEVFGRSKSIIHKDVTQNLKDIDSFLYDQVRAVLTTNKAERHIRGGVATRTKWQRIKKTK